MKPRFPGDAFAPLPKVDKPSSGSLANAQAFADSLKAAPTNAQAFADSLKAAPTNARAFADSLNAARANEAFAALKALADSAKAGRSPALKLFAAELRRLSYPEISPDAQKSHAAYTYEPDTSAGPESPCVDDKQDATSAEPIPGGVKSSARSAKPERSLRISLADFMTKADETGQKDQMLRVADVAKLLRMSEKWTRRYFAGVEGVLKFRSPAKRSKRSYSILVIPMAVLAREVKKRAER